jgi:hypothetical protein
MSNREKITLMLLKNDETFKSVVDGYLQELSVIDIALLLEMYDKTKNKEGGLENEQQ